MKCLGEKDLILFYYRELKINELEIITRHLKDCRKCFKKYEKIEAFFTQLQFQKVKLDSKDYEKIIETVRDNVHKTDFWLDLKEKLVDFWDNLRLGLSYRPVLVPILAVLIILLVMFPFIGRISRVTDRDFDILQIEMELSLEDDEWTVSDIYDDETFLTEELLNLEGAILHNSAGEVRRKT